MRSLPMTAMIARPLRARGHGVFYPFARPRYLRSTGPTSRPPPSRSGASRFARSGGPARVTLSPRRLACGGGARGGGAARCGALGLARKGRSRDRATRLAFQDLLYGARDPRLAASLAL